MNKYTKKLLPAKKKLYHRFWGRSTRLEYPRIKGHQKQKKLYHSTKRTNLKKLRITTQNSGFLI